jgi:ribosomal protein S18 acetylase RimI-like enzyme
MIKANYKIRDYEDTDKEELLQLYKKFGEYFVGIDDLKITTAADNYAEFYFQQLIKDTSNKLSKILVVEVKNKKLIGFAAGNIHKLTPETDPGSIPLTKGRILELFIEEKYRGNGIGKKLMMRLQEFFMEKGCKIVNVEVFAPNRLAYQFYNKLGFVDRNYDLIKKLKS